MPNDAIGPSGLVTTAVRAPVTKERRYCIDTDKAIEKPYVGRATYAPSVDQPNGSQAHSEKHQEYTVMQQHILFWDRDADGEIWPLDTYRGFRDLGFNMLFSFLTIFIVNLSFTLPTSLERSFFPDPFFRVFIPHIHKGKHGSDTGIYDNEGRFVPSRFEDLFARYAKRSKENPDVLSNSLSLKEVFDLMKGQRCAVDPFGWSAAMFEWVTAWLLLQQGGRVDKEDLRRLYDGSIFFEVSEARQSKEGWNKGWGIGGDGFIGGERVLPFSL